MLNLYLCKLNKIVYDVQISYFSKLVEGDCGKIVYLVENGKRYPLGMYIGQCKSNNAGFGVVYQAVILYKALEDIAQDYGDTIGTLNIYRNTDA